MMNALRRPKILISVALVGVLMLTVGLYLFQPWRVFTTTTVNETLVSSTVLNAGSFRSLEHETTGKAELARLSDGNHAVQFAGLDTSDGPDLHVYLSTKPASASEPEFGTGFTSLGKLKGNKGDQVYAIPADIDLSSVRSVVIWCQRFSAGFGVAPLDRT